MAAIDQPGSHVRRSLRGEELWCKRSSGDITFKFIGESLGSFDVEEGYQYSTASRTQEI